MQKDRNMYRTLINVAVSGDRNVIKKEAEKSQNYEDLTTECYACGM
jgi:hypothetical protein